MELFQWVKLNQQTQLRDYGFSVEFNQPKWGICIELNNTNGIS